MFFFYFRQLGDRCRRLVHFSGLRRHMSLPPVTTWQVLSHSRQNIQLFNSRISYCYVLNIKQRCLQVGPVLVAVTTTPSVEATQLHQLPGHTPSVTGKSHVSSGRHPAVAAFCIQWGLESFVEPH